MAWHEDEPVRGGYPDPSLLALSGLERMRASFRKQMPIPPIGHLLGLQPVSASPANVTFAMPSSPWLQTDAGVFFAGTVALVADAPLGSAVLTGLGPGQVAVTSDLSINFLRPTNVHSNQLIARARPIEVGRTLGLSEALVEDGRGRLVAHCTGRQFVIDMGVPPLDGEPLEVETPVFDSPDPYLRPIPEGSVDPERFERMTFLEAIDQQASGELLPAPFVSMFGMSNTEAGPGRFSFTLPSSPWFTSPAGTIYGGILAYAAEVSMMGAISSTLEKGEIAASLDLKVQFLRPVFPDGRELKLSAKVMHRGRSFAAAQTEITNADGKTVVLGTSSAVIRSGRGWSSFAVADDAVMPETSTSE